MDKCGCLLAVSFINLDKINNRREEIVEMAESSKSTNKAAGKGKLPISNATTSEPGKGAAAGKRAALITPFYLS